jgi:hypothetical protein
MVVEDLAFLGGLKGLEKVDIVFVTVWALPRITLVLD